QRVVEVAGTSAHGTPGAKSTSHFPSCGDGPSVRPRTPTVDRRPGTGDTPRGRPRPPRLRRLQGSRATGARTPPGTRLAASVTFHGLPAGSLWYPRPDRLRSPGQPPTVVRHRRGRPGRPASTKDDSGAEF